MTNEISVTVTPEIEDEELLSCEELDDMSPQTIIVALEQSHEERTKYLIEECNMPEGLDITLWPWDKVRNIYAVEKAKEEFHAVVPLSYPEAVSLVAELHYAGKK
jgi:hypothetical protein